MTVVIQPGVTVIVVPQNVCASIEEHRPEVVVGTPGMQGRPGPPGTGSDGAALTLPAGATIHAHRVVVARDGQAFEADITSADDLGALIGLALNAAQTGDAVTVQTGGALSDPSFSFTSGAIWCGAGGTLVQTPPADGWVARIGTATGTTGLIININLQVET